MSYGCGDTAYFADNTEIEFSDNKLTTATKIDGRNLKHCLYLNLFRSTITSIDTEHISGLLVLILGGCNISSLNTLPFTCLVYLDISGTYIKEILTESLG